MQMQTAQALRATRMNQTDATAVATTALAALLLAVALAFVVIRAATPTIGVGQGYVTGSWSERGMTIMPAAGSAGGLRAGDTVAAVDGVSLSAWTAGIADPSLVRPSLVEGRTVRLDVLRDGSAIELAVPLRAYPLADVLLANWSTLAWALALLAIAAFVFARRPHEPAARALLVLASAIAGSSLPWMLGIGPVGLVAGGAGPILFLAATFGTYALVWSGILHFALAFPRPLAARPHQRDLVAAAYVVPIGAQLAWIAGSGLVTGDPLAWIGGWTPIQLVVVVAALGLALAILAAQWLRAPAEERRALRWVSAGALITGGAALVGWFLPEALTGAPLVPWNAIGLAGLPFAAALGLAVSRQHLFGIERVLQRSYVYGGLTAGIVGVYALSVILLSAVLPGEGPYAVTLLATGAAALVALPLRDRLQRSASRLFYGDRDDPYRAIVRLGEQIEASLNPSAVLPLVAETVARSLRLPYAAIELGGADADRVVAAHGSPQGALLRLPLTHHGDEIGWLVVAERAPDEPFGAADHALLAGLARQAGAAAYAVSLTAELQRSRRELVSAREEERRRLRRELHDGVGPSLAGSLMKLEASRGARAEAAGAVDALLAELSAETRRVIEDVRRMAHDLRPPTLDQLGLVAALEQEAERLSANGETFSVRTDGPLPALPAAVEVAAYRIGLEALTNVLRHAAAAHAWVVLTYAADAAGGELVITIDDDGRGVPRQPADGAAAPSGVGMTSMRERAEELGGSLVVGPSQRGGFRVVARLPVAPAVEAS